MTTINKTILARFAALSSTAGYNDAAKNEYKKLGRKILKATADALGLAKGEYDIRWNPGGIAVSGDNTLHTDTLYLGLHDNCGMGGFYYRTCKGRRDYCGGPNQWVKWAEFVETGIEGLAARLRRLQK